MFLAVRPHCLAIWMPYSTLPTSSPWVFDPNENLIPAALALIPLAHGSVLLVITFLVAQQLLGDTAYTVFIVTELSLRQSLAPDQVLGRVNAAMQLLTRGMWPLGALAGGWLASSFGERYALFAAAAGVAFSSLWLIFSPLRRTSFF